MDQNAEAVIRLLISIIELSNRYLNHPEVKKIPFAMSSDHVASRGKEAIRKAKEYIKDANSK